MKSIITTLFLASTLSLCAQDGALRKAQKELDNYAYAEAIERYENMLSKGADTNLVAKGLGDSYFALRNMEAAANWYAEADASTFDPETECKFALAMHSTGEASDMAKCVSVDQSMVDEILNQVATQSGRFSVTKAEFNQEGSDFGPVFLGDQLIFVSDREEGVAVKKRFSWNNRPFLDLFVLREDKYGMHVVERIDGKINTPLHEGPGCFNADGTEFYFTRNQTEFEGKRNRSTRKLEILHSQWENDAWTTPTAFVHNSTAYSTGHPALTPDNQYLFFASDMEGSVGGTDIWFCEMQNDGTWSEPKNAGPNVNTTMNELFPSVDKDGFLFFASDGHVGLGGLDIFESRFENGACSGAINVGSPVNSTADDFSIAIDRRGNTGYFSSNRDNEASVNDDLYRVSFNHGRMFQFEGTVVNAEDQTTIPFCNVHLLDADGQVLATSTTDENGTFSIAVEDEGRPVAQVLADGGEEFSEGFAEESAFRTIRYTTFTGDIPLTPLGLIGTAELREASEGAIMIGANVTLVNTATKVAMAETTDSSGEVWFDLDPSTNYEVIVAKEGYFTKSGYFTTTEKLSGTVDIANAAGLDLSLEKIEVNKTVRIENINYDYNDFRIRTDAGHELDKIVALLKDNPTMKIELASHTDARGSDSYNLKLSRKRAKSAVDYIVSQGIQKDRLHYKGYGETVLLNDCGNGTKCDDAEHEVNRRTEFKVIEF